MEKLYNENNQKRMYALDEEGVLRIFHRDKSTGIIIRDFVKKDAKPYYNSMLRKNSTKLTAKELNQFVERFEKLIESRDMENDSKFSLVITTITGKIIGVINVEEKSQEEGYTAYLKICVKDDYVIKQKGEAVVETIKNLQHTYQWRDCIFVKDEDDNIVPLEEAVA